MLILLDVHTLKPSSYQNKLLYHLILQAVRLGASFENPIHWGVDLASEHERFIAEKLFKKPVFLYNYPKEIKAFYMKVTDGINFIY